jgi:hypothetical protein
VKWTKALWHLLASGGEIETQEEMARASLAYLWLKADQLRRCQRQYHSDSFLLGLLAHVYHPLLAAGHAAPLPIVVYLSVGYSLRTIEIRGDAPLVVKECQSALNRWLDESLRFEKTHHQVRYSWVAIEQFIRRSLAEIAPELPFWAHPQLCDSVLVQDYVCDTETKLLCGQKPRELYDSLPVQTSKIEEYLVALTRKITAVLVPLPRGQTAMEEQKQRVAEQQAHAVRYYLGRAGVSLVPKQTRASEESPTAAATQGTPRQQLLDFHALAGYQAYGKFLPGARINLLLEQLRRRLLDPDVLQRVSESSIDGTTRRGKLSQVLKWQLALSKEGEKGLGYVYERYFDHKMLYLRRVSSRSHDLYLTLLVLIDLAPAAYHLTAHGGRRHSLAREACAHILQDCYQILYQVPKLYADAIVIFYEGSRVVWQGAMVLSEGMAERPQGVSEDIFLQDCPRWLDPRLGFADPTTYFHFLMPAFCRSEHGEASWYGRGTPVRQQRRHTAESGSEELSEQILNCIRSVRLARVAAMRTGGREPASNAGLLSVADLMVTICATAERAASEQKISVILEPLHVLALNHRQWCCECGGQGSDQISLRLLDAGTETSVQTMASFQRQDPVPGSRLQLSMRQSVVHDLLHSLHEMCSDQEMV